MSQCPQAPERETGPEGPGLAQGHSQPVAEPALHCLLGIEKKRGWWNDGGDTDGPTGGEAGFGVE